MFVNPNNNSSKQQNGGRSQEEEWAKEREKLIRIEQRILEADVGRVGTNEMREEKLERKAETEREKEGRKVIKKESEKVKPDGRKWDFIRELMKKQGEGVT